MKPRASLRFAACASTLFTALAVHAADDEVTGSTANGDEARAEKHEAKEQRDPASNAAPDLPEDRRELQTERMPVPPEEPIPATGSEPGTPLRAYDPNAPERGQAHEARSWATEPDGEGEDAVLWVPRALLFIPRLVLHVVWLPLRAAGNALEEHAVVEHAVDLVYNDERTAAILPHVSAQSGFGFSYGARAFHNDLFGHGEYGEVRGTFGGLFQQAYAIKLEGDTFGGTHTFLQSRLQYDKRPAMLFYGIGDAPEAGPGTTGADPRDVSVATRFSQERFLGLLSAGPTLGEPGSLTKVGASVIYNHRSTGPEARNLDDPSLQAVYDPSLVPGFGQDLDLLELQGSLAHDGRDLHEGLPYAGTYFEIFGGVVPKLSDYTYQHYGAELATHVDLFRKSRVLIGRMAVEGVSGDLDEIPFTDLSRLGGGQDLRGYRLDRFRDRIASVATVEYRYPIHSLIAGTVFVDAGRVGRDAEEVFGFDSYEDWRVGAGGGFVFHTKESTLFSVEAAYGEQFTIFLSTDPLRAFSSRRQQL